MKSQAIIENYRLTGRITFLTSLFLSIAVISLGISCKTQPQQLGIQLPEKGQFFKKLSEYGIFEINGTELIPSEKITKYEPTNQLFSDYSVKDRYVYLPEGQSATLREDGHFNWPEGTVLIKNFSYDKNQVENGRRMETRLLIKESETWKAVSYQWNDEQTEAQLKKLGEIIPMSIANGDSQKEFDYIIPNKNQCKSCHNANEKLEPIGFRYANLDQLIDLDGKQVSQIDFLKSKGIISIKKDRKTPAPMIAYNDETQDVHSRALAYLDINCGHCHRPNGPGNTSGLYLQYDETRSNHLGICKPPVAAGKGAGGRTCDITAGNADASILYYRMNSKDPGEMMPEVGRSLVHEEGVALIKAWIDGMEERCE